MAGFQRILKNLGAMFTGRLLTIIQQVIIPPIFIHRYSTAQFGEWGVLSGAVAALGMLNFGVQTYMNQDLAVRYNRGEAGGYQVRQSTALRLLGGVVLCAMALSLVVFVLPVDTILKLDIGRRATQVTAYLLACQVLLNILFGYFTGIYMGVARAHRGAYWSNFQAFFSALLLLLCVSMRMSFPVLASAMLLVMSVSIVCVLFDLHRTAPDLFPNIRYWDRSAVKDILRPSGYFGLIAVSTFLTYQAPLIVLQRVMGPVAVAGFIVMRLVFSMCRQMLSIFTQSMGAEITHLFGREDWPALSRLYDYSERFVFFLIPLVNTGVLLMSPILITVWMHKRAELFSPYPYVLSAAISMVISLKEHKFQFQFSTNTHESLARTMFSSYVMMVVLSVGMVHFAGVAGFLWTWLAVETFQVVRIIKLNTELFAYDALEFTYLRRLLGFCLASLVISLGLLQRTSAYPLLWQLGIATTVGVIVAGISWPLFGVGDVVKKMSGQLFRKFA